MRNNCKRAAAALMVLFFVIDLVMPERVYGTETLTGELAEAEDARTENTVSAETKEVGQEMENEANRRIRIGYIDYECFIEQKEDGTYEGYGVEYLKEISKYTGWEYEYVYDRWDVLLEKIKTGEVDFICHAQKTSEREQEYLFSKYSIGAEASVLYVREDDKRYYYNDFESFDGMRIAVLAGSFQNAEFSEYAHKKGFGFSFTPYKTQQDCFDALDAEQVDAVAMGSLAAKPGYKVICRFGADPFYFMTGEKNQGLLDELNDALGQISADGYMFQSELYQKYYGELTTNQEVILTREEAEYRETAGTIQIACIPNRKPFSYLNEDGEIDGITIDILKLLEERSGLDFEYVMMPVGTRSTEYLAQHPDTLIAGIMSDNQAFLHGPYLLTDHFYSDDVVLACLNGKEYNLDAEDEYYKLAIPRSYSALDDHIRENYPQFEIIPCTTFEECLDMVQRGDADFTAQNVNVIKLYLQNPHYEEFMIVPTFFMDENSGIVSYASERNRVIINILNKCIRTISQDELSQFTVDHTIVNHYTLTWGDMFYKFRYPMAVVAFLLLLLIALMLAHIILRRKNYQKMEEKNRQLAEAVAQADSANHAKSQFLARMSHEIRTPMNAIVGLTALAKHRKDSPEQVKEYLEKIETSSKVLLNIINDVLDMSAIESDKIKIAQKPFDLREILDEISAVYTTQCKQKGVTFEFDRSGVQDIYLIGDGLRLNQVLLNLISNAYKFTPEGGRVHVKVEEIDRQRTNAYYKITVADTGEGMTPDMLERLFRPFEQEGADTAQKHGGSGLGLSIAKNLVELMGGSISCQSEKGKGTIFTVSLPFLMQADIKKPAKEAHRLEEPHPENGYDFGGRKVLLAEDTEINADIVREILGIVNMQVDHAWNGREAVDMFLASEPGTYTAILMDVQMPEMNGYRASELIRSSKHPEAAVIPIYAMTANAFAVDVSAALSAGMNGHIAKPVDTDILFKTLRKAMEKKE